MTKETQMTKSERTADALDARDTFARVRVGWPGLDLLGSPGGEQRDFSFPGSACEALPRVPDPNSPPRGR